MQVAGCKHSQLSVASAARPERRHLAGQLQHPCYSRSIGLIETPIFEKLLPAARLCASRDLPRTYLQKGASAILVAEVEHPYDNSTAIAGNRFAICHFADSLRSGKVLFSFSGLLCCRTVLAAKVPIRNRSQFFAGTFSRVHLCSSGQ